MATLTNRLNQAINPRAVDVGATSGWNTTWTSGTGGTATYAYGTAVTGPSGTGIVSCRRKTWTVATTDNANAGFSINKSNTEFHPVSSGDILTVSLYVRVQSATAKNCRVEITFYDRLTISGAVVIGATSNGTAVDATPTLWQRISWTGVVPDGALGMRVVADTNNDGLGRPWLVGDTFEATGLLIEQVPALDSYFDGASTNTASFLFSWTGAVNLSTSKAAALSNLLKYWDPAGTPADRVARTNLMNNPRAVNTGVGGWEPIARWGTGGAGNHYYIQGTGGPSGTGISTCYRKTWSTAPTSNIASGHEIRATVSTLFPCTPGDVLTVSVYMRISVSGTDKTAFPTIQFYDRTAVSGAVTVGFEQVGPTATLTLAAWVRVSHTVTVPAGAAGFRLIAEIANSGGLWAVGNQLDVTGMMIEKVASLGSYFDGASTDTASFDYDWVGTVNNSSSTSDPWKSVVSPAGPTGPQGSAGASQVRASAGGCSFAGSLASYTSGSGWYRIGSLKPIAGFMDLNPCFTVKATGDHLTVARTGTIMITWNISLIGSSAGMNPSSVMQIGDAPWLQRYSWPLAWEDTNGLSVILPNVTAGTDIPFWVNLVLNGPSCPINAFINAAMIQ